jgi:ABC-type Fe3+ transport system substrate-binding protein
VKHLVAMGLLCFLAALAGCRGEKSAPGADHLVIYSPHSDEIRAEFETAFKDWYRAETGREVDVSWPDAGGTSQILKRLQDKFLAGRYDVDLVFGGGAIYERMKQLGFLEPYRLPDDVLSAIPPTVAGQPVYDPEFHWYGAAISTFGLIYNKQIIADRHLPTPETWEAMADPKYFGFVGAGDPAKSGSVRKAYDIILQAYGYEKGMAILTRMGANAREFYASASDIPRACAKGEVAVGPCIDFYAQRQMLAEGGEGLGFVTPKGLTVVNCDPIGILKGAPNRHVAERFVEFVMRPEGQRLWMLPPGAPGGPKKYALERLAVLPSLYGPNAGARPAMNPFELPPADFYDAAKEDARLSILPDYLRIALVENHELLRKAWQALIAAGLPPADVALLVQPLISEDEMSRLGREVWTPVLIPEGASPEERDRLAREEETRLRRKSDLETAWSETLRRRYEQLF